MKELEKFAKEMLDTLLLIPPKRLRLLAELIEVSEEIKEITGSISSQIQDDVRGLADASETVLNKILYGEKSNI